MTSSFFAQVPVDEATSLFISDIVASLEALEARVIASEGLIDEDAATVAQLKQDVIDLIATIPASGTSPWKAPVRLATSSAVSTTSAPASYDGETAALGDRILLLGQPNPANNGIWLYAGADVPLTRPTDADTPEKQSPGIFVLALEGLSNARTLYRADGSPGALEFVPFTGGAASAPSGPSYFDIASYFGGTPPAGVTILSYAPTKALTIPAGFAGSSVRAGTAPSTLVSFEFRVGVNRVGTLVFEAGGSSYFLSDTPAAEISLSAGDLISIVTPSNVQGVANISFTLATTMDG